VSPLSDLAIFTVDGFVQNGEMKEVTNTTNPFVPEDKDEEDEIETVVTLPTPIMDAFASEVNKDHITLEWGKIKDAKDYWIDWSTDGGKIFKQLTDST